MMALLRCTNVVANKTLACYSLVAEGFIAHRFELALRWNRRQTYLLAQREAMNLGGSVRKLA